MRPNRLRLAWVNLQEVHHPSDRYYMPRSEALEALRAISGLDAGESAEDWEALLDAAYGDVWKKLGPLPEDWDELRELAMARFS